MKTVSAIVSIIALISTIGFLSIGGTAIILSWKNLKGSGIKWIKPWFVILGGFSTLLLSTVGFIYSVTNKEKPKYEQISEPLYRKI